MGDARRAMSARNRASCSDGSAIAFAHRRSRCSGSLTNRAAMAGSKAVVADEKPPRSRFHSSSPPVNTIKTVSTPFVSHQ